MLMAAPKIVNNRVVILLLIAMTDGSVPSFSPSTKCLPTLAGTCGVFLYEGPLVNGVVRKLLGASCRYSVDSGFIPVDTMADGD